MSKLIIIYIVFNLCVAISSEICILSCVHCKLDHSREKSIVILIQMSMDASTPSDWRCWCRLCAKRTTDETVATADTIDFLHSIVEKHLLTTVMTISNFDNLDWSLIGFLPQLSPLEDYPLLICTSCKEFLLRLNAFSERCVQTESLFNYLLTVDTAYEDAKLHNLRIEYGLDAEEVIVRNLHCKCSDHYCSSSIVEVFIIEAWPSNRHRWFRGKCGDKRTQAANSFSE